MTMMADTLYSMLAGKLRGFEHCDVSKVYRQFVRGKGRVNLNAERLVVTFPRKAHNPILRNVPWHRLPRKISWIGDTNLELKFQ